MENVLVGRYQGGAGNEVYPAYVYLELLLKKSPGVIGLLGANFCFVCLHLGIVAGGETKL